MHNLFSLLKVNERYIISNIITIIIVNTIIMSIMLLLATRVVPNSFYTNILELLRWTIPIHRVNCESRDLSMLT